MGEIRQQADVALNDSDKIFTVPGGQVWRLQFLTVNFISTATPGNRDLRVEIGDGTNLLWFKEWNPSTLQAASLTRDYYAAPDKTNDADFDADGRVGMEMEGHTRPPGYTIRVFDKAAIDAAADDMVVRLLTEIVSEYST